MKFFETRHLTKHFGGLTAVNDINFEVEKGEIYGLIGPNGSGKTTLFNLITGYHPSSSGEILFQGQPIHRLSTWKICKLGIGRTFQIAKPLRRMTVLENVMTSAFNRAPKKSEAMEKAMEVLEFCELASKKDNSAKGLTIGDRKRLEIARALATAPELLLLDETMAGLTPQEQTAGAELIRKIRDSGITIIIVEHIMHVIMNICDRLLCINYGQEIARGTPAEVANNQAVIEAYLGKE
ncbi:ABC transporter ATP-binding protein [Desulforhabdus amnigena]|jgi:branched-chain amino acid transport system ATP-binding protein|uniref:ABC transporter ATP-binding protein n=1 Tax=Desulforhabdus amnigena TaxID=40218 RepID=A0A9W6D2D5_9BACT|nr:ABC transporter ATP-binding protein [Desulforhabdus amnigena]NLJ27287.1 ABC transporter ATP-binding protein [Deltaproteobacteria bacterium]GLI32935.1 ABC transporter ATP-binding protein [Desulforhabdus amnigena]